MLTVCYAAKGGSGTSVTAAAIALATERALLVDLAGDTLEVLDIPPDHRPGLHDWLSSEAEPDALDDLVVELDGGERVLPAGDRHDFGGADPDRLDELWAWIALQPGPTVVDAGSNTVPGPLAEAASELLLVTRACYLALRRAHMSPMRPTGVIVIREPGRALDQRDIAAALGVPVVAEIQFDPAVARAVDAGLLASTLPRSVRRAVRHLAA